MKNLKLFSLYSIAFIAIALFFSSCSNEPKSFDEALLIGKWQEGTDFQVYENGHMGYTYDTSDDVSENDTLQRFKWSLEENVLTHIHIMEMGENGTSVPKVYTVLELTSTTLKYEDDFDKSHTFIKVKEEDEKKN